jgi:hypothetical protein
VAAIRVHGATLKRIIGVTSFVAALGAIGGAMGGVLIVLLLTLLSAVSDAAGLFNNSWFWSWEVALTASGVGAAAGVVLGPLFAWTLLRNAPLWRAVGETAFASAIGYGLSLAVGGMALPAGLSVVGNIAAPLVFPVLAALRLRHEVNKSRRLAGSST